MLMMIVVTILMVNVIQINATTLIGCPASPLLHDDIIYYRMTCEGSGGNGSSSFNWTLTQKDTDDTLQLATCNSSSRTASRSFIASSRIRCSSSSSEFTFVYVRREYSGLLTCTETMPNLTVQSASCQFNVTYIQFEDCTQRGIEVEEGKRFRVRYKDSRRISGDVVKFTLFTNSGLVEQLATCPVTGSCSSNSSFITLDRWPFDELTFETGFLQRSHGGILQCSFTYNGTTDTDTCPLVIYSTPQVNCSFSLQSQNWSMAAICDITKFFSSTGEYLYQVEDSFTLFKEEVNVSSSSYITAALPLTDLKLYVDSSDNKEYYTGPVYLSWSLPALTGLYTEWRVHFYPSGESSYTSQRLIVSWPSTPSISCEELVSGSCTCVTEDLGSPPGRLQWRRGRDILVTGDYGIRKLVLPSVDAEGNGPVTVSCVLDWIQPRHATISLNVNLTVNGKDQRPPAKQTETSQEDDTNWAAIGVAALLVVIVIVGVVVAIVLCRTGRLIRSNTKSAAAPVEYDATDEHVYTDLRLPPPTKKKTTKGKTKPVPEIDHQNPQPHVYVNDV